LVVVPPPNITKKSFVAAGYAIERLSLSDEI
jgi:hypothetical protein